MSPTASKPAEGRRNRFAVGRVPRSALAEGDQRPRLHPAQLHAVRRRRVVSRARDRADEADLGHADRAVRRGAQEGRARHLPDPRVDHRARARLHRPRSRNHRRAPDRCAAEARHHAERRAAHGARRAGGVRLHAGSAHGGGVHQVPEDAQRGRVRRVHRRHSRLPELARAHGPAGRLRARPHHRRLPARGALRRGPADRAEEAGEAGPRSRAVHRRDHPRP